MAKVFRKLQVFTKTTDFKAATKLVEVPLIRPNENEIRVKNIYAGVNASDINITSARYFTDGIVPFDIGLEALGIVDALGSKVPSGLNVGQPVLVAKRGAPFAFSEYSYTDVKELIPLPDLRPNYLVSFINGLTASIGLDHAGRVQEGDKVFVTAAAGGTGQIVVQWAKQRGAHVIAMTSSDEKGEYLKQLGADCVINYKKEDIRKVLEQKYPEGVDVVWETVGGDVYEALFKHLANRGRFVIIGSTNSYKGDGLTGPVINNLQAKLLMGSKSLVGFMLFDYTKYYRKYMTDLISMIHSGKIQAKVDLGESTEGGKFFGVDQIHRAEEHLHNRKNIGKVVVQLQEQ